MPPKCCTGCASWSRPGMVIQIDHPELGPITSLGNPVKLSRSPAATRLAPPRLGEQADEVLKALCSTTRE